MEETFLSPEEAFDAMRRFLQAYYDRGDQSGGLACVLSDLQLVSADGLSADPAAWEIG